MSILASFKAMTRAFRKVFPQYKIMMTDKDFDLCAVGAPIPMPPACNDNEVSQ